MEKSDKSGQTLYFASVMLIFVGFAFFGIFILQNTTLTGNVVSDVNLPSACDVSNIEIVWDSVFQEDSSGISVLTSGEIIGDKCSEYFANKTLANNANMTYILHGYTLDEGTENVSYVYAEVLNATEDYFVDFLNTISTIDDVSTNELVKDASFLETYVQMRSITPVDDSNKDTIYEDYFRINGDETWGEELDFMNNFSYFFYDSYNDGVIATSWQGQISSNYSYAEAYFDSYEILQEETGDTGDVNCTENIVCGNWSACFNDTETRTCVDENACVDSYNETRACGILLSSNLTCVPDWETGNWSECTGGLQIRTVMDLNSCGNETDKPALNQTCEDDCTPNWVCGEWNPEECPPEGKQQRTCSDNNICDPRDSTKTEEKSCNYEKSNTWIIIFMVFVVIGLALGLLFLFLKLAKNKEDDKEANEKASAPINEPPATPPATAKPATPMKHIAKPLQKIMPQNLNRRKIPIKQPKPVVSNIKSKSTMPKLTIPSVKTPALSKTTSQTSSKPSTSAQTKPAVSSQKTAPAKKPVKSSGTKLSIKSELDKIANPKK